MKEMGRLLLNQRRLLLNVEEGMIYILVLTGKKQLLCIYDVCGKIKCWNIFSGRK